MFNERTDDNSCCTKLGRCRLSTRAGDVFPENVTSRDPIGLATMQQCICHLLNVSRSRARTRQGSDDH